MVKIKIRDLETIQTDSFIATINDVSSSSILGGENNKFSELVKFAVKSMEFILLAYAIDSIANLATSLNNNRK